MWRLCAITDVMNMLVWKLGGTADEASRIAGKMICLPLCCPMAASFIALARSSLSKPAALSPTGKCNEDIAIVLLCKPLLGNVFQPGRYITKILVKVDGIDRNTVFTKCGTKGWCYFFVGFCIQ